MRKMFAFLMALAMTVQLVMPAWADVAQEETAETVATEEAQGATEEAAEEPTEETSEETEGETEETTEESTEALPEETEEEETEPEETVEEAEELDAAANSGTCGKSAVWTMDGNGHLTISGTGVMEEFIRNAVKKSVLTVTIESGITGIGESCFSGCQNIISIEIPDTVKIISRNCFGGCFALQSVSLPDGVEEIGEYAFTGCKAMETLHLGKGLKVIHDGAFQGDGNLTTLRLPEGVETIGDGVFAGCESMTTVGLPKSMTRIGESAFLGCGSITDVYYGGSWADWHSLNIRQYNDNLTGAKIHYGTSHVHDFVYVPEKAATCTEGGNNAYYLCQECQGVFLDDKGDNETTLDAQTLPALGHSMTEVPEKEVTCAEDGNHAYYICGTCHKVYTDALGQTETTVEAQTIQSQGHNMVKTDAVAPTRTTTGNNAYYTCGRCGKVYKDRQGKEETTVEAETLPVLGILASGTCGENLTWELDDGGTLTVEGSGEMEENYPNWYPWFDYRNQITAIIFSGGVTSIGREAFAKCENLYSISIPRSVMTIKAEAFRDCCNLTDITFNHRIDDELMIDDMAFGFNNYYQDQMPVDTVVRVPSLRMMNVSIVNYDWEKGPLHAGVRARTVFFEGTENFQMEGISISTEGGASSYELGMPIKLAVTTDPVDATDDYNLYVVENQTTAQVYLSKDQVLTTLSTGVVTLRAECVNKPEINSEIVLTITKPTGSLTNLTVTTLNDYPGEAELGKPVQMVAVFTPANAADRKVTWSLQNGTGKATIDEDGLLTPLSFGTVAVYAAASNGVEGSCTVNIVRYAEEIMILMDGDPDISRLGVGEGKDLSVLFSPDDCTTDGVKWTVVNGTGVAELDSNKSRLTGKRAGTITLIATANDSKKQVAKKEITITDTIRGYALPDGSGNIYYNTETGTITGSDSSVRNVIIPSQIDGVTIVKIAPYAFKESYSGKENMTSVSIPATVTEIGKEAFYCCRKLSVLRFAAGSQLKKIGERAFCKCESLTSLEIPNSVAEIGDEAFKWLKNLKNITLSGTLNNEKWLGRNFRSKDDTLETATFTGEIVQYGVPAKKIILADTVTEIGQSAFGGISYLEEVVIGKKVTTIGDYAFADCHQLVSACLPDGLKTIGKEAFRSCHDLTDVILPSSLQVIGKNCFESCSQLQIIDVSKVPDTILEKKTCLTGMVIVPELLVRATGGKTEIEWSITNVDPRADQRSHVYRNDQNQQWYLNVGDSGTYRITCRDTYTGARGSKLIEIKTGTLIRPSDTGYLVSGSKLALSAWSMPGEKKTSAWWSLAEGGSNYASIDSKGVLTARTVYSAQQVTVIAQPYDGSEQVTKTIWILPKTTGLGLLLDGGPLGSTLNVDQAQTKTLQLSAKVYPDGALQEVSWSSSNESVARVDETGLVTLAKPGTVVIQAATKDGSKLTAQVTLNVTYLDANSKLTLVGEVPQPGLEPGQTVQLTLWGEAAIEAENVVFSVPSNQSAMGSIDGSGLFTAGSTAGNVTVTAALKDDPLGRSASITIPVLPMQAHTVLAVPVLDGVGQVTQRDGVYEAIFRQTEVEGGYRFRLRVHAQNYQGQPLSGKFVYTTTDASIAKVSADGLVTVQKGAEGLCAIGVRAADALGTGTEVWVSVRDYSPRLETTKLTVNSALEEGCSLVLAASYGNDIENVFLSDGRFSCSWEEDKLTISAKESLKNGTYPMTLEVVCADNMYKYTLFVKVTKTLPKVTVKQREKFNLFYQDSSAELKINVAGNLPYHYEFLDNTDFRLDIFDDEARLYFADPQNAPAKPDTKATLRLWLEGYREPVDVKLNIATVNKGPKVTTAVKASTLNTALTTSNTLRVRLNGPEPGSMEAWSGTEGIEAVIDGCDLCLTLSEVKNTTATVYLRDTNWAQPIKLTHKITVTDKLPTLKAASALKLDSLFTQTEAWTELVLSQGNLSLVTAELKPVAKAGTAAREESDKLSVTYDPDACSIVARIADPDKPPKAGTYSFNCTGILENGGEIPGGVVKVTVAAAKPKVKLSASSVKLNKALDGWERVEIPVTVTGNNRVVDFEGLPEGMTYNEDTGKLTVMLSEETASGGSYGLCPVVESNETGQRAKLPTKVSFKVQVYTSDKLAVSLSAKGKLNTLDPESSIAYTVTKVSNCLNPVEGVSLEGLDGDKFQAELDTTSAKPVVRLQMLPGQSYATNVGYKVRFRFFVAGREVLSPMQTVKITQAALKVTAPKSLVYFQAQTGILRFSLAANAPIGEVALSAKTAPELLTALGEDGLRFDGSQLELSVSNPAALKAGKSYTLQLEVTPEYNAENGKPTLVKLTVKVMK